MKPAIALLSLVLVACSPSQAPAAPEPSAAPGPPAAPAMARRGPVQEASMPMRAFRAFGTEPFWNVAVDGTTLTYTTPDDMAGVVMQGRRRSADRGVEVSGSHDGRAFVLSVKPGTCSDGMSDNLYPLVSTFRLGELDYTGCGEAAD